MPRILLVDDDDDVRTLLEHVLIAERYEVDPAATVGAARALLERNYYNLLLTDMALPDGSGMQVAEEAQRRGTPVIILTAYAFRYATGDLARFDVLLKPVRPAELIDAVNKVLKR
jgi:DNA-binding response OmpR family regulator